MADPTKVVHSGPGTLYKAPLGTTEPSAAASSLSSPWIPVGYTDTGVTVSIPYALAPVEVAEEIEPIAYDAAGGQTTTVSFAMAEATADNLLTSLNLGAGASGASVEPPTLGSEVRIMLAHVTQAGALWIFRQCINGGTAEVASVKAPGKKLIQVVFNLEKPDATTKKFKVFKASDGTV